MVSLIEPFHLVCQLNSQFVLYPSANSHFPVEALANARASTKRQMANRSKRMMER